MKKRAILGLLLAFTAVGAFAQNFPAGMYSKTTGIRIFLNNNLTGNTSATATWNVQPCQGKVELTPAGGSTVKLSGTNNFTAYAHLVTETQGGQTVQYLDVYSIGLNGTGHVNDLFKPCKTVENAIGKYKYTK